MKNRILTFIIGVLTGAIIAVSGFLIYSKTMPKDNIERPDIIFEERNGGNMEKPNNMEEPPEKPNNI